MLLYLSSEGRIKNANRAQSARARCRHIDYSISSPSWRHNSPAGGFASLRVSLSAVVDASTAFTFLLVREHYGRRRKQIDAYTLLVGRGRAAVLSGNDRSGWVRAAGFPFHNDRPQTC